MKKFVCLLMVAMLMLAMGVTAFARAEPCENGNCPGTLELHYHTEEGDEVGCPIHEDGIGVEILHYKDYICDTCGDLAYSVYARTTVKCACNN